MDLVDFDKDGNIGEDEYAMSMHEFWLGKYAARNSTIQRALNDKLGIDLELDGDLTSYDGYGNPIYNKKANTVKALEKFVKKYASDLGDEKDVVKEFVEKSKSEKLENLPLFERLLPDPLSAYKSMNDYFKRYYKTRGSRYINFR